MEKKGNMKDIIENFQESELYKNHKKLLEERRKTIKKGNNIIHLQHLGQFSNDELQEINKNLSSVNLELSSYDKSGDFSASLETSELIAYFLIHQQLINEILKNVGNNAIWEIVKSSLLFGWKKLRNDKYYKITSSTKEEKKVKYGLKVELDKNTRFEFELSGDLDKEIIENSLDKILDFLKDQKKNETSKLKTSTKYSKKEKKWKKLK
jgi:hypothetical protein